MNVTKEQRNARLAHAAFPHWFGAILAIYAPEDHKRAKELSSMASEARSLGWKLTAFGEPYNRRLERQK